MLLILLFDLRADLEDIVRVGLGYEDDYEDVVHLWLQIVQFYKYLKLHIWCLTYLANIIQDALKGCHQVVLVLWLPLY